MEFLAIIGLAWAGKKLTEENPNAEEEIIDETPQVDVDRFDPMTTYMNTINNIETDDPRFQGYGTIPYQPKRESGNFSDIVPLRRPQGDIVRTDQYQQRETEYQSTLQSNQPPVDRVIIGPGVGVGADVQAADGFHSMYRSMPILGTAHKLTTLPGRAGPAAPVIRQAPALASENTNLEDKRSGPMPNPSMGRAATTGMAGRQRHMYTERQTNRSQTGMRNDTLEYGGPKHFIAGPVGEIGDQSRDGPEQFGQLPLNHGGVGINDGYKMHQGDLRTADKRGNEGRSANPGRMNVRMDPVVQGGAISAARVDYGETDWKPSADGSRFQNYTEHGHQDMNPFKGNENTRNLQLQRLVPEQLSKNPLNHNLAQE